VSIVLKTGETLVHPPVSEAKGSWQKPLNEVELQDKFFDCAAGSLGRAQATQLFEKLNAIDRLASVRELPVISLT
jgi:hypothetical protein